ncbi:MAG: hypothetical protein P1V97_05655 [Planctomycetota bacterium]|nr:hypothetical protein [Planctomycetota bacterium]
MNELESRINELPVTRKAFKIPVLRARTMKALRCVYCHDNVHMGALGVSNCSSCQTCFHDECREMLYGKSRCPTFGCEAILIDLGRPERQSAQSFGWELEFLSNNWSWKGALISGLNIVIAVFVTVAFTTLLLSMGLWFLTFRFPPMIIVGILMVLGSFLQAPAMFILSSQWLSRKTPLPSS